MMIKKRLVGNRDGTGGLNLTYREIQQKECPPGIDTIILYRRLIGEVVNCMVFCAGEVFNRRVSCKKIRFEEQNFDISEVPFRLRRGWYQTPEGAAYAPPDSIMSIFKAGIDSLSSFN